jgi:hypothetical protein
LILQKRLAALFIGVQIATIVASVPLFIPGCKFSKNHQIGSIKKV